MFGPIFVIIAFFICFLSGVFICRYAGACGPLEFGLTATIGAIIFILFIAFLRTYLPAS